MNYMNKLFILFVTISGLVLLLSSGCKSSDSASQENGWIEMKPIDEGHAGLIDPDDYK